MNFNSFDLSLLRVLDALLATRSTMRAGEQTGLSQPAVSAAQRLRESLADPILLRQGASLVPTDYAEALRVTPKRCGSRSAPRRASRCCWST